MLHHLPILLQSDNIYLRPEIDVYVRTFDGFALTADTWEHQRQILLDDLIGKKVTRDFGLICLHFDIPFNPQLPR